MRRAQHVKPQRALLRLVVDELPLPGEQSLVFQTLDRLAHTKRILPGRMFISLSFELLVGLGGVLAVFPPETTHSFVAINAPTSAALTAANGYDPAAKWGSAAADVHDFNGDIARLRTAFQADADALAGADLLDLVGQVGKPVDRLAVGLNNDVAERTRAEIDAPDAGALGRASGRCAR